MHRIYVAGGDPRELQEVFRHVPGVCETCVGALLAAGETERRAALSIAYDPKKTDISTLADLLFAVVDPRLPDGQGRLRGLSYCAGLWYEAEEDRPHVELYMNFLRHRGRANAGSHAQLTVNDPCSGKGRAPCHAKSGRAAAFAPAPAEAQNYYQRHDKRAAFIDFARLAEAIRF